MKDNQGKHTENLLGLMILPFGVSLLIFGGAGSQVPIEEHSLLLSLLHRVFLRLASPLTLLALSFRSVGEFVDLVSRGKRSVG